MKAFKNRYFNGDRRMDSFFFLLQSHHYRPVRDNGETPTHSASHRERVSAQMKGKFGMKFMKISFKYLKFLLHSIISSIELFFIHFHHLFHLFFFAASERERWFMRLISWFSCIQSSAVSSDKGGEKKLENWKLEQTLWFHHRVGSLHISRSNVCVRISCWWLWRRCEVKD